MVWRAEYYYKFCLWASTKSKRMTHARCSSHMSTRLLCFVLLCQAQWNITCSCSACIHRFMKISTFPVITKLLALLLLSELGRNDLYLENWRWWFPALGGKTIAFSSCSALLSSSWKILAFRSNWIKFSILWKTFW